MKFSQELAQSRDSAILEARQHDLRNAVFLSCLSVIGVIGNALLLDVYIHTRRKVLSTHFISALAAIDLIISAVVMPLRAVLVLFSVPTAVCAFSLSISYACVGISIMLFMCITFDRFQSVCLFQRPLLTTRQIHLVVAWGFVSAAYAGVVAPVFLKGEITVIDDGINHMNGSHKHDKFLQDLIVRDANNSVTNQEDLVLLQDLLARSRRERKRHVDKGWNDGDASSNGSGPRKPKHVKTKTVKLLMDPGHPCYCTDLLSYPTRVWDKRYIVQFIFAVCCGILVVSVVIMYIFIFIALKQRDKFRRETLSTRQTVSSVASQKLSARPCFDLNSLPAVSGVYVSQAAHRHDSADQQDNHFKGSSDKNSKSSNADFTNSNLQPDSLAQGSECGAFGDCLNYKNLPQRTPQRNGDRLGCKPRTQISADLSRSSSFSSPSFDIFKIYTKTNKVSPLSESVKPVKSSGESEILDLSEDNSVYNCRKTNINIRTDSSRGYLCVTLSQSNNKTEESLSEDEVSSNVRYSSYSSNPSQGCYTEFNHPQEDENTKKSNTRKGKQRSFKLTRKNVGKLEPVRRSSSFSYPIQETLSNRACEVHHGSIDSFDRLSNIQGKNVINKNDSLTSQRITTPSRTVSKKNTHSQNKGERSNLASNRQAQALDNDANLDTRQDVYQPANNTKSTSLISSSSCSKILKISVKSISKSGVSHRDYDKNDNFSERQSAPPRDAHSPFHSIQNAREVEEDQLQHHQKQKLQSKRIAELKTQPAANQLHSDQIKRRVRGNNAPQITAHYKEKKVPLRCKLQRWLSCFDNWSLSTKVTTRLYLVTLTYCLCWLPFYLTELGLVRHSMVMPDTMFLSNVMSPVLHLLTSQVFRSQVRTRIRGHMGRLIARVNPG